MTGDFAAIAITLYAAHHVGDYWVQTDNDAKHKGDAGASGVLHCLTHVLSYLATQTAFLLIVAVTLGLHFSALGVTVGLLVSGVTHYTADRREHGLMFWLARRLPGKADLLMLGKPRAPRLTKEWCDRCGGMGGDLTGEPCSDCLGRGATPLEITDNPSLGTGTWALDQAWHIFWGVFVAALLMTVIP